MTFSLAFDHGQAFLDTDKPDYLRGQSIDPDTPVVVFRNRKADHHNMGAAASASATIRTRPMKVRRPRSQAEFQRARIHSMRTLETLPLDWDEIEVPGPDIEDRQTLLELAKMTGNAYALDSESKHWYSLDERWNSSTPFGWGANDDGFRGHVFVTPDNSSVILSIKGTTLAGNGPTARKDKLNDNRCGHG
ncbi:putative lipase atg15 [Tulasnella sp. 403]|nr:putative lipase atg15 [Tulasnella sp. 403]